ncbi:MAG TPA: hypothetical protein VFX35_01825 [Solirubrobacterales bacterium]|nr:hypothetical protein [Solirubrobacterales bacterium]
MAKKILIFYVSVLAFASLALPAIASASNKPTLTDAGGHVKVGAKIWGTNIGNAIFTDTAKNALVTATTAHLTGEVTRNDSGFVEGTISTFDFSGTGSVHADNGLAELTGSFGNAYVTVEGKLCIRSTPANATDEFEVGTDKGKCSEGVGKVEFIIGSTTAGECTYETTNPVTGDFTTGGAQAELTVRNTQAGSGAKLIKGSFLCPSSGMLSMKFGLETDTASGSTADPIWIDLLP